jgi:transposase
MPKRYAVRLTDAERAALADAIAAGAAPARTQAHARILLKADEGGGGPAWTDVRIAEALEVGVATVERVRRRWADGGLDVALHRRPPRRQYRRKLDGAQEAHLVALACSAPPPGRERWTLRLLAHRLVELEVVGGIAPETVRQALKKTNSSRG